MAERITVLVGGQTEEQPAGSAAALESRGGKLTELELDTRRISDEVSKLLHCMEDVEAPQNSRFEVSEVQFNLGISTKGKLAILCAGAEAGVEAAIKVTIKRST